MKPSIAIRMLAFCIMCRAELLLAGDPITMTHGPMLGQLTSDSIVVWARTSQPTSFEVRYGTAPGKYEHSATSAATIWDHDCTGVAQLRALGSDTRYYYEVYVGGLRQGNAGTFKTLPDSRNVQNPQYNPEGLFNFRFEIGSCANQNPEHGIGHSLPLYRTMNERIANDIDFAIMNGDWLYEEMRETSPQALCTANSLTLEQAPRVLKTMPTIAGVIDAAERC
jgi:alkaline phosphatase D